MSLYARIQRAGTAAGMAVALLMSACNPSAAVGGEAKAAEAEFVGVVALAVEDAVAKELGLTDAQREKLQKLIGSREDSQELTELVLTLKDLAPADREAKLAPFRRESEALALATLTPEQRARLQQIRVRREGLGALAEAAVAEDLALTAEQRGQVAAILKERGEQLKGADQARMHVIRAETERRLAGVLTQHQRAAWEALSSGGQGGPPAAGSAEKPVVAPPNPENVFGAGAPKPVPGTAEGAPAKSPTESPTESPAKSPPKSPTEPPAKPAPAPGERAAPKPPPPAPGKLRFNFKAHPWAEVLQWFASQAGYSYVPDFAPQGTFNYIDDRDYTPAQAIDLLNSVLLTKGYSLVPRDRMLFLYNLDQIPPNLVELIPLKDLDQKGQFELTSVAFPLEKLSAEEARDEIQGLMGPQGKIVTMPRSQMIQVTETGGRLRAIRLVIERIEGPGGPSASRLRSFTLKSATPDELLAYARQLFGIKAEEYGLEDGSIRLAVDPVGKRLLASGKLDKLAQLDELVKTVDVSPTGDTGTARTAEKPQLVIYPITVADPEAVLKVMQTLLAGEPDARLAIDPKTSSLVAMALPSQHATIIRPALEQYEGSARHVEVIRLRVVEPQMAVLAINKLFGSGDSKQPNPNAPQVDADPINHLLLVRATAAEIAQMRILLEKMGETDTTQGGLASGGGTVRMIPWNSRAGRIVLEQLQEFYPLMHPNVKLRVVTPSALVPTIRTRGEAAPPGREEPKPEETAPVPKKPPRGTAPLKNPRASDKAASSGTGAVAPASRRWHPPVASGAARVFLVAQTVEAEPQPAAAGPPADPGASPPKEPAAQPEDSERAAPKEPPEPAPKESEEPTEIVVAVTPGGLMVVGTDLQALDEFEKLLRTLTGTVTSGGASPTIFYLKYAKAPQVAQTLDQLLGGGTLASGGSRGASMMGDLASAALGDTAGGIVGALLDGGGSTITPSGTIRITPEARLNALIVQANPADVDLIEQLLKILDQPTGPEEVLVFAQSRIIPVLNTQADRIAEMVKDLYKDRLIAGAGGQQGGGGPPSPQQFIEMLRGGPGGPGGRGGGRSGTAAVEEVQKMSITVDVQTNSLVVSAPEPLLTQVEQLVRKLDQKALDSTNQVVVTRRLHNTSPTVVQSAVSAVLGESVQFGSSVASSSRRTTTGRTGRAGASTQAADAAQRAAFFQMMQMRGMGGGGFGQPGGGFQGGGGRGGGGGFQGGGGRGGGGGFQGGGGRGGGGGGRGG